MSDAFEKGDVITLRSGSVKMTVEAVAQRSGAVKALWFTGQGEIVERWFSREVVEKVIPPEAIEKTEDQA